MIRTTVVRLCALLTLVAGGALVSAQGLLPSTPPKGFGASVTPAFEGWFDNPDGSHTFLIGYFNRNTAAEVDVPVGPNNQFTAGTPDMGQPTHFLTGRRYGMFVYTVPKEFVATQKLTWSLTVNGVTSKVPFYMSPDYNISPMRASEQGPRGYNLPPVLRLEPGGASFTGPLASVARAISRTATAGIPMPLHISADDDAQYSSGANTPLTGAGAPVELVISKYRGGGGVTIADPRAKTTATRGGKPDEPFSGTAATTVTFEEPGDFMLHVTANDYSGNGGGGAACCWTTAIVKVSVKGEVPRTTGGQ
ncbi:MAG: hypothetical protein Q7R30_05250 [Acidobacteriota bacterium]|nr:hypothetical protein [Acidobacteriota bacterium]